MDKTQAKDIVKNVLETGSIDEKLGLFAFTDGDDVDRIYKKFILFSRSNLARYFKSKDSPDHKNMAKNVIRSYTGEINYLSIAYRGFAKTTYGKTLLAYLVLNDKRTNPRRYMKVLTKDLKNSKQVVTDVYNIIVELRWLYGDIFISDGDKKREETMGSFTTQDDVKLTAGTIGQTQRGHIQDAFRPDWIWFDDVEDSKSIKSTVQTMTIIESIEEAITGLSADGNYFVTANYISEYGAVQHFKDKSAIVTDIFPILDDKGNPTWERFTQKKIDELRKDSLDWFGEYMCDPSRSDNKYFDIDLLDEMVENTCDPIRIESGLKVWKDYFPGHRYAIGADVAGGSGLDSSTAVVLDYTTGEIVATYKNNKIDPRLFGKELARIGNKYGGCVIAPENNSIGVACVDSLKDEYSNIYRQPDITIYSADGSVTKKLGFNTNSKTKPNLLGELKVGLLEGHYIVYDKDILVEMKSYVFNDIDIKDPLPTRHFDLLMAFGIAWNIRESAYGQVTPERRYENYLRRSEKRKDSRY